MSRVCFVHVTAIKLKTLMEGSLTRTGTTTTKSHGQTCTDKARLSKTDAATAAASQESLHLYYPLASWSGFVLRWRASGLLRADAVELRGRLSAADALCACS